jgi:glucokinase
MDMQKNLLGVDIGGTKCAVIFGKYDDVNLTVADKIKFPTASVDKTLEEIMATLEKIIEKNALTPENTETVGVSCGGPLDSARGIIMSPPNLLGWDDIPIVELIENRLGIKAKLQNDANAGALAEWRFGAGKGAKNMVFMTFGTGLGGGMILNGRLYEGTNGNAGEFGHIRMADFGPVGYGKSGSFEGFASGSGIAQLAKSMLKEKFQRGEKVSWCRPEDIGSVSAMTVADAAFAGDDLAKRIYEISGSFLGKGLSVVIDIINPEVIVLGGIYARSRELLEHSMRESLESEALSNALGVCDIKPAALGESIGDFAALSVAIS